MLNPTALLVVKTCVCVIDVGLAELARCMLRTAHFCCSSFSCSIHKFQVFVPTMLLVFGLFCIYVLYVINCKLVASLVHSKLILILRVIEQLRLAIGDAVTLGFLYKAPQGTKEQRLVSGWGFFSTIDASGDTIKTWREDDDKFLPFPASVKSIRDGQWHQIYLVWDDDHLNFYVDGHYIGHSKFRGSGFYGGGSFQASGNDGGACPSFSSLALWRRKLSESEIADSQLCGSGAGSDADYFYPLSDKKDHKGNGPDISIQDWAPDLRNWKFQGGGKCSKVPCLAESGVSNVRIDNRSSEGRYLPLDWPCWRCKRRLIVFHLLLDIMLFGVVCWFTLVTL